ncbi:nitroreductase [Sphingomonas sp. BIUV-7]|uniref:Nitroreductase n=1 Tax=Sphingomonas natans TaxID=3063330 RepID=A0ABT8Y857_9SPHN|nr:nitroreductase [Sphingomonas sp. BIUV-7]MDO6414505.1 nitroreductase [Sphingomonas sp. BIUV-7]
MRAKTVSEAVESRRTVRAFLPTPVPRDTILSILDRARMAPSGCNFQPWEATILTGEPLRALQAKMLEAPMQDPVEYDVQPKAITEEYRDRLRAIGALMYGAEGVGRDDAEGRRALGRRNLISFGAPVLLLCYFPRFMGPPQWSDVGMWLQTIMLLAREEGLDTCPQEALAIHARLIKAHIGVDDTTHIFFCGLGIGFRDAETDTNRHERPRVPLERQVRLIGF